LVQKGNINGIDNEKHLDGTNQDNKSYVWLGENVTETVETLPFLLWQISTSHIGPSAASNQRSYTHKTKSQNQHFHKKL